MKRGHLQKRELRKDRAFTWCRVSLDRAGFTDPGKPAGVHDTLGVQYRLFLRDSEGKKFAELRSFSTLDDRRHIARMLRGMRAQLRWVVDQVEFARLGMEDPTPRPAVCL